MSGKFYYWPHIQGWFGYETTQNGHVVIPLGDGKWTNTQPICQPLQPATLLRASILFQLAENCWGIKGKEKKTDAIDPNYFFPPICYLQSTNWQEAFMASSLLVSWLSERVACNLLALHHFFLLCTSSLPLKEKHWGGRVSEPCFWPIKRMEGLAGSKTPLAHFEDCKHQVAEVAFWEGSRQYGGNVLSLSILVQPCYIIT